MISHDLIALKGVYAMIMTGITEVTGDDCLLNRFKTAIEDMGVTDD